MERYHEIAPRRFKSSQLLTEDMKFSPKDYVAEYVGILNESTLAISDLIRVAKKVKLTDKEME